MDGAAPMRMTNRIACSRELEQQDREREPGDRGHRLQPGDHRADRRAAGSSTRDDGDAERRARHDGDEEADDPAGQGDADGLPELARADLVASSANTGPGPGSTYDGFQPAARRPATTPRAMATAATLGHGHAQTGAAERRRWPGARLERSPAPDLGDSCSGVKRAWRRTSLRSAAVISPASADTAGRLDPAGTVEVHVVLLHDPAGPAGQQHHAVTEPHGLADVVGHEEHGQAALPPDRLELVVQQVAGHRIERAERLVHQQDRRLGGQRAGDAPRAGACRRTARAGAGRRSRPGAQRPGSPAAWASRSLRPTPLSRSGARRCPAPTATGTAPTPGTSARRARRRRRRRTWAVEAADDVQQRRLAAAGGPDQADELPRPGRQRDAVEGQHPAVPGIPLGHAVEGDRGARRRPRCEVPSAVARRPSSRGHLRLAALLEQGVEQGEVDELVQLGLLLRMPTA